MRSTIPGDPDASSFRANRIPRERNDSASSAELLPVRCRLLRHDVVRFSRNLAIGGFTHYHEIWSHPYLQPGACRGAEVPVGANVLLLRAEHMIWGGVATQCCEEIATRESYGSGAQCLRSSFCSFAKTVFFPTELLNAAFSSVPLSASLECDTHISNLSVLNSRARLAFKNTFLLGGSQRLGTVFALVMHKPQTKAIADTDLDGVLQPGSIPGSFSGCLFMSYRSPCVPMGLDLLIGLNDQPPWPPAAEGRLPRTSGA